MKKITTMLAMILMVTLTQAQIGANDPTFNATGTGATGTIVYAAAIQSDGKTIIGGTFLAYNGISRNKIARLNTDGTLDVTFDPGTGTGTSGGDVRAIAIQSDGKIIIGGNFTTFNGIILHGLCRLNTDGSMDGSFVFGNIGTVYDIYDIAIQSDGKIIICGNLPAGGGSNIKNILRLNTDGTINSFNSTGGANGIVRTVSIQSNDKIIIGGSFTSVHGTAISRIARLNNDANINIDPTFNPSGLGANDDVYTTSIQSDGKIIIGGKFTTFNGISRTRIARLKTTGADDPSFNSITGANNTIFTTSIQSDGKIIIGGNFTSYGTAINRVARVNTGGTLDGTFNPSIGANNIIYATAIQSDGKIIIGGSFTNYDGTARGKVARINISGVVSIKETVKDKVDYVTVTGDKFKSDTEWTMYDMSGRVIMNGGPGTFQVKNTGMYIISTKYGAQKYFKN